MSAFDCELWDIFHALLHFKKKIQLIFVTRYFYIGHSFWNRIKIKALKKLPISTYYVLFSKFNLIIQMQRMKIQMRHFNVIFKWFKTFDILKGYKAYKSFCGKLISLLLVRLNSILISRSGTSDCSAKFCFYLPSQSKNILDLWNLFTVAAAKSCCTTNCNSHST